MLARVFNFERFLFDFRFDRRCIEQPIILTYHRSEARRRVSCYTDESIYTL